MFYKVAKRFVDVPTSYSPESRPEHHANEMDAYKFAFLPRTTVAWNSLPHNAVLAESVDDDSDRPGCEEDETL